MALRENTNGEPKEIQSVARAIRIIESFDSRRPILALGEICGITELNKSTAHGILHTLCKYGYIDRDPGGRYMLGPALANKGVLAESSQSGALEAASVKYLKQLTLRHRVTGYLFSYINGRLNCLEMLVPSDSSYGAVSSVLGRKMAYHAAASGKVVMAHFTPREMEAYLKKKPLYRFTEKTLTDPADILRDAQKTRENGYAHESGEVDDDISAVAAPVYDGSGALAGTLSASGQTEWIDMRFPGLTADILAFSRSITKNLS